MAISEQLTQDAITERFLRYQHDHPEFAAQLARLAGDPDIGALIDEVKAFCRHAGPRVLAAVERVGIDLDELWLALIVETPHALPVETRDHLLEHVADVKAMFADPSEFLGV